MHGVEIQGTVVILDEAHNIVSCVFTTITWLLILTTSKERVCEDSASFDLTSHDMAQCISDVGHILDLKKKEQNYFEEGGKN